MGGKNEPNAIRLTGRHAILVFAGRVRRIFWQAGRSTAPIVIR